MHTAVTSIDNQDIYVISDLHSGNGSRRDNMGLRNRKTDLFRFLDYVEACKGQLIVLGDLMELWRCKLQDVVEAHDDILDRLAAMDAIYILGNHDKKISELGGANAMHPFLNDFHETYFCMIGGRKFKFMHGHEYDPFIHDRFRKWIRIFSPVAYAMEYHNNVSAAAKDALSNVLLEAGEQILHGWHFVSRRNNKAALDVLDLPDEGTDRLRRPTRTKKMLSRYYRDRMDDVYDIAVVGHTHKPGQFGQWYFNSGSWTGYTHNFLRIRPDGRIDVLDWTNAGPVPNTDRLAC